MPRTLLVVAALCLAEAAYAATPPASAASHVAPASLGNINNDAMTVKGCRERLALPKVRRPRDDDPNIDLDAVCRNMLDSKMPRIVKKASAPSN